jgi:hypothetical protein
MYFTILAPQKEASIVNTFGILNSLKRVILAVCSLDLGIVNLFFNHNLTYVVLLYEKKSHCLDMIYGKSLVVSGSSGILLPYMNIFLLREWPWKSQIMPICLSLAKSWHSFLE